MMRGPKRLLMRRIVIVLASIMTVVVLIALFQDVLNGPDAGWNGALRVRGATSDVGSLLIGLVFASVAGFWAFRNWNRTSDVLDAPKRRKTRR